MKAKLAIVLGFFCAVAAILYFNLGRPLRGPVETGEGSASTGEGATTPRRPTASTSTTEITMLYSTEKKEWIEGSLTSFQAVHPEIKVTLIGKGSLEAVQSILDGKDQPTLWSPADSLVLGLLESDWRTAKGTDLFALEGTDTPQPLVLTPLVLAVWEDRANVLIKSAEPGATGARASGQISWRSIHDAVASPQGWPRLGGKPEWGFVRLGHTDPTRSNSGLQALFSMTLEYYNRPNGEIGVADILQPGYQKWLQEIEKGVTKFEASTGTFMTDMIRFGPSKFDIAVVYENLVIAQIANAQGRWGNLKVYYPARTLWNDHPVALLQAGWVSAEQKNAARRWVDHLRSREAQERALVYGFRPGDNSVPVRSTDSNNPFNRLAQYGVSVDIPPAAPVPDGAVVRNLLTLWSRLMKPQ